MSTLGQLLLTQYLAARRQTDANNQLQAQQKREDSIRNQDMMYRMQQDVSKSKEVEFDQQFKLAQALKEQATLAGRGDEVQIQGPPAIQEAGQLGEFSGQATLAKGDREVEQMLTKLYAQGRNKREELDLKGAQGLEKVDAKAKADRETAEFKAKLTAAEKERDRAAAEGRQEDAQRHQLAIEGMKQAFKATEGGKTREAAMARVRERQELALRNQQIMLGPKQDDKVATDIRKRNSEEVDKYDRTLRHLDLIEAAYKPEFSTIGIGKLIKAVDLGARTIAWNEELIEELVPEELLGDFAEFRTYMDGFIHAYVKDQTGQSRTEREFRILADILPSLLNSPTTFRAKLRAFQRSAEMDRQEAFEKHKTGKLDEHFVPPSRGTAGASTQPAPTPSGEDRAAQFRRLRAKYPNEPKQSIYARMKGGE